MQVRVQNKGKSVRKSRYIGYVSLHLLFIRGESHQNEPTLPLLIYEREPPTHVLRLRYSNPTTRILISSVPQVAFHSYHLSTIAKSVRESRVLGVDTSPSYLLFQTLFPLVWTLTCMIWMELTRTDVVFSRIAMVLFLCRNKSSRNDLQIHGATFQN